MRSANVSTWPYSIVQLVRMPSWCASRCTSIHSSPVSFLSAIVARTAGLNTSAPPPGSVSSPASRSAMQHVAHRHLLDARDVRDLDGGERLDVHLRVTLLEPAEHLACSTRAPPSCRGRRRCGTRASACCSPSPPRRTPGRACSGTRRPPSAAARTSRTRRSCAGCRRWSG